MFACSERQTLLDRETLKVLHISDYLGVIGSAVEDDEADSRFILQQQGLDTLFYKQGGYNVESDADW
jgi:hypothetical protein